MTNFEKYKDEILGIIESNDGGAAVVCGRPMACDEVVSCGDCSLGNEEGSCDALFIKWLYEEVMFDCGENDSKLEDSFEKTSSCENCRHDDKGTDEYPCAECCERYLLKFEPKPKRPEMKTCPCCGGRVGIVKHDDGERSCKFCKYGDIGEDDYPCIECTERYSNQFEPKPKEPKLKTCPFCGNRWEWRR